ncbi:MAG: hypothetical protein KME57_12380 [Scytonema hyalinum WJT4-NPBG1]|nr:hypothetical protein [Scytonema hyalinum WJT4-NPBG1]
MQRVTTLLLVILSGFNICIRLQTNNPHKVLGLREWGLKVVQRVP